MGIIGAVAIDAFSRQTLPDLVAMACGAIRGCMCPGQGKSGPRTVVELAHLLPAGNLVTVLASATKPPQVRIIPSVAGHAGGAGTAIVAVTAVA